MAYSNYHYKQMLTDIVTASELCAEILGDNVLNLLNGIDGSTSGMANILYNGGDPVNVSVV